MSRLFRVLRGQLLSAKRAGIESHSRISHQQGQTLPLYRHLSANRTAGLAAGRLKTEKPCPLGHPLVESVHAISSFTPRILGYSRKKGQ